MSNLNRTASANRSSRDYGHERLKSVSDLMPLIQALAGLSPLKEAPKTMEEFDKVASERMERIMRVVNVHLPKLKSRLI